MNVWIAMRIALRALAKNRMRAGLTVLGIVIGIAAVTTMVSIGQSATQLVQEQVYSLGTNVVVIFPSGRRGQGGVHGGRGLGRTLTAEDAAALREECPAVLAASPLVFTGGQVIYGNANWNPREMVGVGADYLTVRNWQLRLGGFFIQREVDTAAKVCVIGQTVVEKLFQTRNPIGETLRIKSVPVRVIGVLEAKGANIVGEDQDNVVLLPFTTVRKRMQRTNIPHVNAIMASARSDTLVNEAQTQIRQLLYERHRIPLGEQADFEVQSTTEIAGMLSIVTGTLTLMLSSIAGISLLVGGIGIMNIMLVSVTERTREIGIRMAVGARSRDILRQFLIEAALLSSLGGLVGVALGIAASTGITMLINSISSGSEWPVVVSLPAAAVAMLFAGAVGLFFGYYPARRASRMDPIEALRYE